MSILGGQTNPFGLNKQERPMTQQDSTRYRGVVRWFNSTKGYGFIQHGSNGQVRDVFVHHSDIDMDGFRTLYEQQQVEYSVEESEKGLKAVQVKPVLPA